MELTRVNRSSSRKFPEQPVIGFPRKRQGLSFRGTVFPAVLLFAMLAATVGWVLFLGLVLWRTVVWLLS
jgi:hypothetical protein